MKPEIHPNYNAEAIVACACGKTYKAGSTKEKMEVEICSNCHPFYTGQEKLIDTAGRVEKFKARKAAAAEAPVAAVKKSRVSKNKKTV